MRKTVGVDLGEEPGAEPRDARNVTLRAGRPGLRQEEYSDDRGERWNTKAPDHGGTIGTLRRFLEGG
jgi:hypothetical protein